MGSGTVSPWQAESASFVSGDLPAEADAVVVGAGVTGAATAWALADEAPDARVVVLDAHGPAHGASGRNAGFLLLGTHVDYAAAVDAVGRDAARRWLTLTRETLALAVRLGETADLRMGLPGSVIGAGSPDEAERLRRARGLLAEDGVASEWLDTRDVDRRLGVHGLDGALWIGEGGYVDPLRLVRAALAQSGATVVGGAAVVSVAADGAAIRVGLADGRSVRAPRVAVALNAWLPTLLPGVPVRPVRAQMLVTEPLARPATPSGAPRLPAPLYSHGGYFYARFRPDGRLLVGGARHLHRDAEVGYDDATTDGLQRDLEAYLADHLTLPDARVERRWSGTMGFSPDELPFVAEVPGVAGAVAVGGFTGHGMGLGLRVGRLVARRLLGRADAADDLLDARRLAAA